MAKRIESDEHPILLQTTVVSQTTGQPVYTLIKLPLGTTIESLASMLQVTTRKKLTESVTHGLSKPIGKSRSVHESSDESLDKATTSEDSLDDDMVVSCVSDDDIDRTSSSTTTSTSSTTTTRDSNNLPSPPPCSPGVATFLSLIPESQRAGCHNNHKANILGGRYVLQKTNSRARLTGPFFCNSCGLRFDWHSSARMHLNFHNRDFEACDKCQKRNSGGPGPGATERTGRPPRCNVCNKSFYLWKTYLAHQDKHKDKVKCPLCCKFFQSLHNVGRHYYDEHNGVPVTCSLCGNGYRAFKQYQTHVETIHMDNASHNTSNKSHCDDVVVVESTPNDDTSINYSIDLPTLQQLDPSIRVFSSVERSCPVPNCGRIFSTQHTMQRHIYDVHSNELLPCGLCGNAYRTYTQFEHHCELFHGENFRVELPVGEINVPVKRKRVSSEYQEVIDKKTMKSVVDVSEELEPRDEPLDMTVVKQELSDDVILPD